jgi:hypothetical protein
MPEGGHLVPNSIDGQKEAWKKAQKKQKNSIISEAMNNKNPNFKPILTTFV